MSDNESKVVVRRAFSIFNLEDPTPLPDILAETFQAHDPDDPFSGVAGVSLLRTAFPDVHYSIEEPIVAHGDLVVTRWRAHGTHRGTIFGVPPTEKEVEWAGITIWRIHQGRIAEAWVCRDTFAILRQIGALPNLPF